MKALCTEASAVKFVSPIKVLTILIDKLIPTRHFALAYRSDEGHCKLPSSSTGTFQTYR